ncbi:MAG: TldD/PmbA family protein [Planctomycetota bacterium]|nr:TldD/PmbA family protein [Planctomycetota bacterium]
MSLLPIAENGVAACLKAGADEAEVYVTRGFEIGVSVEAGSIKSASQQTADGVGIRAFKNTGLGFAYVNSLDEGRVKEAAARAVSLAKVSPSDENNVMPEPSRPAPKIEGLYDAAAETFEVGAALRQVHDMLKAAHGVDPRVAIEGGGFSASASSRAVVNSKGVKAEDSQSLFSCLLVALARDGEDVSCMTFEFEDARNAKGINAVNVGLSAAKQAVESLGTKKIASFKGTVVLHPFAVETLLAAWLLSASDAGNVQKGMSKWAGKIGTQVASSLFTVEDDGLLAGGTASTPFDREGIPPAPMKLVNCGILENYFFNSYTARKDKKTSNGHAAGGMRQVPGIGPTNVRILPGPMPLQKMLADVRRGVLVTRLAGWPNTVTGDFSGVVKGGFLIENGAISVPVTETLISGNVAEFLGRISGVSQESRKADSGLTSPYVRIDDVSITGR